MPMLLGTVNIFKVRFRLASHHVEEAVTHIFPDVDNYETSLDVLRLPSSCVKENFLNLSRMYVDKNCPFGA